jgi:cytochrome P450
VSRQLGRRSRGLFGSLRESVQNVRAFRHDPIEFYATIASRNGTFLPIVSFAMFGHNVLVNDPGLVAQVLADPAGRYGKRGTRLFEVMQRTFGGGLFSIDGSGHLMRRRRLQPAFSERNVAALQPQVSAAIDTLVRRWLGRTGVILDIEQEMLDLTLDVVAGAVIGAPRLAVDRYDQRSIETVDASLSLFSAPVLVPRSVPVRRNRRLTKAVNALNLATEQLIDARSRSNGDDGPPTLLDMLLAQLPMRGDELRDEVSTLVSGAYHSTTRMLTWTCYLLALPEHRPIVDQLEQEARLVLGEQPATVPDFARLTFTSAVIHESLRLYPPVWVISRRAAGDATLDGVRVTARSQIAISPFVVHRNPAYWERPTQLYPEHFLGGATGARPRLAFIPFGAGNHKCPGNNFAMLVAMLTLPSLVRTFRFHPPTERVKPAISDFMRPDRPVRIAVEAR